MATLTPTLTLASTDATSDSLSFSVTDSLSVAASGNAGLSRVTITTSLTLTEYIIQEMVKKWEKS